MKPITIATLFFKAIGLLFLLRSVFYMGYFLLAFYVLMPSPPTERLVSDALNALYTALELGASGSLLVSCAPLLARITVWGVKD
jgi:hypothetical protein